MAVVSVQKDIAVLPAFWCMLARLCDEVYFLGWQDERIAVYRINGEELPKDDKMVTLHISINNGIDPFICMVETTDEIWQPLTS